MRKKKTVAVLLSLVMVLGLLMPLTAYTADNTEVDTLASQIERLQELKQGNVVGDNVPQVIIIAPPSEVLGYFVIGLKDYPTDECIEFILAFTGIPRELAYIGKGSYGNDGVLPYNYFDTENTYGQDTITTATATNQNEQMARLLELKQGNVIGVNVPRVNAIMPPTGDINYFLIGLVDEPTQECIEFILAFTGIPRELAYIGKGSFYYETEHFAGCTEYQTERLWELKRGAVVGNNIPQVYIFSPPTIGRDYFLIGLVNEPTSECVEFILAFTGIPVELALIAQGSFEYEVEVDVGCVASQIARVRELRSGHVNGDNLPQIYIFSPPADDSDYFLIGLEDEPTPECIEFILAFTGIPSERAFIGKGTFEYEIYTQEVHYELQSPLVQVGQMISIVGVGSLTTGPPTNVHGTSFVTAPHVDGLSGTRVNLRGTNTQIGTVMMSRVRPNKDYAIVNMRHPRRVSPYVPGVGLIRNFRGTAVRNDNTISMRGNSGPTQSWVYRVDFEVGNRFGKLATYPNRASMSGDSGAALIRTSDNAVLGVRRGRATIGPREFGIYTHINLTTPVRRGDVDGNGWVDDMDVMALRLYLAGHPAAPPINRAAADADLNGFICDNDVMWIRMYIAGHPGLYPPI